MALMIGAIQRLFGHDLLNINGLSNNASSPKVQGFQSTSEGSTFLVPLGAKGEFCLLLLLDINSLHQNYVNTCTLNGDNDSFGVTDHKAEERLVSTAKKTSAGSIQNCENEPMLEERSVSKAGKYTSTSSIQNFENESMSDATDRSTSTGFQIPEKV